MQPPKKPEPNNTDHLTIRLGDKFEASAGGKLAIVLVGLIAILLVAAWFL